MSLSINTTNQISAHLLSGGLWVAAGALAGHLSSIRVVGGATFGAANYCAGALAAKICNHLFNLDNPAATQAAKLVAAVAKIAFTLAATVFVMASAGFPITMETAIGLTVASCFTWLVPAYITGCLLGDSKKAQV